MSLAEWAGKSLGSRTVAYTDRDVILYALAVGAKETDLDLVFEDRLRVLPTFGLTLAQWAPDILSDEGVFDDLAVQGAQSISVKKPMPRSGELTMHARVSNVWDKGSAAVFEIVVETEYFEGTWTVFCPGRGGFGGERGPKTARIEPTTGVSEFTMQTFATQAALYRLTGDRHHIHIDPEASAKIGQPKPILQGLCTLAAATLAIAEARGAHPADLSYLSGRFSGPVVPGEELVVRTWHGDQFEIVRGDATVISGAEVRF